MKIFNEDKPSIQRINIKSFIYFFFFLIKRIKRVRILSQKLQTKILSKVLSKPSISLIDVLCRNSKFGKSCETRCHQTVSSTRRRQLLHFRHVMCLLAFVNFHKSTRTCLSADLGQTDHSQFSSSAELAVGVDDERLFRSDGGRKRCQDELRYGGR